MKEIKHNREVVILSVSKQDQTSLETFKNHQGSSLEASSDSNIIPYLKGVIKLT